jgi:hypothetical protein
MRVRVLPAQRGVDEFWVRLSNSESTLEGTFVGRSGLFDGRIRRVCELPRGTGQITEAVSTSRVRQWRDRWKHGEQVRSLALRD